MTKRSKIFAVFAILTGLVAVSCQKQGADLIAGSYTYKISGVLGLVPTHNIKYGIESDTTYVSLATEQGQLNISRNGSNDRAVLTWNDITGDASTTTATLEGASVNLDSATKTVWTKDGLILYGGNVTFTGNGNLYDNMLVMSMTYQGELSAMGTGIGIGMTIVTSKIECVAKAN